MVYKERRRECFQEKLGYKKTTIQVCNVALKENENVKKYD